MAPTFRLSPESLQMIENICNGFRRFENYHIVTTDDNWSTGTFHVDVYHMGRFCSKYMFCPTLNGKIGSIAIYGVGLPDHLKNTSIYELFWFKCCRSFHRQRRNVSLCGCSASSLLKCVYL